MQDIFNQKTNSDAKSETNGDNSNNFGSNINMDDLPNADDIQQRISGMLDGKLGKLAKEIAEETAQNLDIDMENTNDMKDVLNNLVKNPTKLMGLVKTVGEKLDTRIKSGELKESELIAEATELMNKMKNMPGMDGIQSMLGKMGMSGLGKDAKMNFGAMEAEMNKLMKETQAKIQETQLQTPPAVSEEELISIFNDVKSEKVNKSSKNNKKKSKK